VLLAVPEHQPYWPDNTAWVARAETESTEQAREAADRARALAVKTEPAVVVRTVVVQRPGSTDLDEVARQAGLLVLGRSGDGGQVAFSPGSTSAELGRRFHCPMLVVHDQGTQGQRRPDAPEPAVVVGMDIHGVSEAVLAVAVAEAVIRGLPLVVVHALPRGKDADRAAIGEGWRKCREALRGANLPAGVPNRLVITQDDPARALLHRVGHADILVIGTHGHGPLAGLIAGSVSRAVLDNMTCDVLLVHPGVHAHAAEAIPSAFAGVTGRS
jgi:nucleotide-binding universal stress UspA family protein